jgi:hypothetical protein
MAALHASAIDLGPAGPDAAHGHGLLDAPDALRAAAGETPRRDNPLVTGGVETYDDAATPLAPRSGGGLLGLASATDAAWETRVPVKAGARELAFEVDAGALAPRLEATLVGPGGERGPWTDAAQEGGHTVLRGRLDAPFPGVWTLRVRATLVGAAQLATHVTVPLGANATRAALLDPRYHLPDFPSADAPTPGQTRTLLEDFALVARAHPGIATAGALVVGIALAMGARVARRAKIPVSSVTAPSTGTPALRLPTPEQTGPDPQASRDGPA